VEVSKGTTYTLNLKANDAIRNLTLLDSPNLDSVASVSDITQSDMAKDNSLGLLITGKKDGTGILNVAYQDLNGTPYKISIDVKVTSSVATESGWGLWGIIGFWVGISSLVILIVSAVVGAPMKVLKTRVNKVLRTARTRTAVHCGISYMLLALALMHGVVVMSHWWSGLIWNNTMILAQILDWRGYIVNLGVLSWVAMLLVAVGGAFYKPLVKTIKINKWRIFHTGLTLIALLAALVHGIVHLYLRLSGG